MAERKIQNGKKGGNRGNPDPHKGFASFSPEMREALSEEGSARIGESLSPTTVRVRSDIENLVARGRRFR